MSQTILYSGFRTDKKPEPAQRHVNPKASCKARSKPSPSPKTATLPKAPSSEELKPASKPELVRATQLTRAASKEVLAEPIVTPKPIETSSQNAVPASVPDAPSPGEVPAPTMQAGVSQDTLPDTQPNFATHDGRAAGESPEMKRPKTTEAGAVITGVLLRSL